MITAASTSSSGASDDPFYPGNPLAVAAIPAFVVLYYLARILQPVFGFWDKFSPAFGGADYSANAVLALVNHLSAPHETSQRLSWGKALALALIKAREPELLIRADLPTHTDYSFGRTVRGRLPAEFNGSIDEICASKNLREKIAHMAASFLYSTPSTCRAVAKIYDRFFPANDEINQTVDYAIKYVGFWAASREGCSRPLPAEVNADVLEKLFPRDDYNNAVRRAHESVKGDPVAEAFFMYQTFLFNRGVHAGILRWVATVLDSIETGLYYDSSKGPLCDESWQIANPAYLPTIDEFKGKGHIWLAQEEVIAFCERAGISLDYPYLKDIQPFMQNLHRQMRHAYESRSGAGFHWSVEWFAGDESAIRTNVWKSVYEEIGGKGAWSKIHATSEDSAIEVVHAQYGEESVKQSFRLRGKGSERDRKFEMLDIIYGGRLFEKMGIGFHKWASEEAKRAAANWRTDNGICPYTRRPLSVYQHSKPQPC